MKYKVVEIFKSLQGEGFFAGVPAIFVRFAGCNLKCPWCDTNHEEKRELSSEEIIEEIESLGEAQILVLTGGEPTIQDLRDFLTKMKQKQPLAFITIETNGTKPERLNRWKQLNLIDYITVSPKDGMINESIEDSLRIAGEIKVVTSEKTDPGIYEPFIAHLFRSGRAYIQACSENYEPALKFLQKNKDWRLSIQMQKILKIS